jgi:hypothetical protein
MKNLYLILLISFVFSFVSAQDPGDHIFSEPKVFDFRFSFDEADYLDSLLKSQEIKEYIPGHLEINGVFYDSVGVRFKGTSSFYGYPGNKKSFRVKFDKYKEYRFDSLKKINLNNGWNDPTMLREKLYLDFLRDNNIPAPRANFARVYIDSIYWGFYSMVEHVDKTFLSDRFGNNDGNLYKSEYAPLLWEGENQENYYDNFALKTNEKDNDWNGIINLIKIINNSTGFNTEIENVINLEAFLKVWAANNLFVNMDAYFGSGNNYYLYQNEDDNRFEWIIWDVNLAFGARANFPDLDIFYLPENRPLTKNILLNHNFKTRYVQTLKELLYNGYDTAVLFPKIDTLWHLIKKDYLADTLKMYTNEEAEKGLTDDLYLAPALKPFIENRRRNVLQQLDSIEATDLENINLPSDLEKFNLFQNYPNPFNPVTEIKYILPVNAHIRLCIYNLIGQEITVLVDKNQGAGTYNITWDAKNYPSGVYFYRLISDNGYRQTKKLFLLK